MAYLGIFHEEGPPYIPNTVGGTYMKKAHIPKNHIAIEIKFVKIKKKKPFSYLLLFIFDHIKQNV